MALDDNTPGFLALLAYVLLQNSRPEKAAVLLEALDLIDPGQPRTLRSLAMAQIRSGKPDRALETLDHLAMNGAADASFHLLRAQALQALNRSQEAASAMQNFLAMRGIPSSSEAGD